jgi:hypothetical protein
MAESRAVFEVTAQNFQAEVVERSRSVPVVLLFWAEQLPPAKDARRLLETLAGQYQGKFALALSDVARDQALAQHLRFKRYRHSVIRRQLIDQMEGPQGERALRAMLDRPTMSGELPVKNPSAGAGDLDSALAMLKQALAAEPNNPAFKLEYADVLIQHGDLTRHVRFWHIPIAQTVGATRDAIADDGRSRGNGGTVETMRVLYEMATIWNCAIRRRSRSVCGNYELARSRMLIPQKDANSATTSGAQRWCEFSPDAKGSESCKNGRHVHFRTKPTQIECAENVVTRGEVRCLLINSANRRCTGGTNTVTRWCCHLTVNNSP